MAANNMTDRNNNFTELIKDKYLHKMGIRNDFCVRDSSKGNVYHIDLPKPFDMSITFRIMYPERDAHNNVRSRGTVINNYKDIVNTGIGKNTYYVFTDMDSNIYSVPGDVLNAFCIENGMNKGTTQVTYIPEKEYKI